MHLTSKVGAAEMTTSPDPDNPDTEGKAVPPYEDRQESGEPRPPLPTPGEAEDSDDAPSGASDEEDPATESSNDGGPDEPESTGPSHTPGTGRAEDQS